MTTTTSNPPLPVNIDNDIDMKSNPSTSDKLGEIEYTMGSRQIFNDLIHYHIRIFTHDNVDLGIHYFPCRENQVHMHQMNFDPLYRDRVIQFGRLNKTNQNIKKEANVIRNTTTDNSATIQNRKSNGSNLNDNQDTKEKEFTNPATIINEISSQSKSPVNGLHSPKQYDSNSNLLKKEKGDPSKGRPSSPKSPKSPNTLKRLSMLATGSMDTSSSSAETISPKSPNLSKEEGKNKSTIDAENSLSFEQLENLILSSLSSAIESPKVTTIEQKHPLLLIHGLAGNNLIWDFLGRSSIVSLFLQRGYSVYTLDTRGAGSSIMDLKEFKKINLTSYVLDVSTATDFVLSHSRSQQLHLIGHSLGGICPMILQSLTYNPSKDSQEDKAVSSSGQSTIEEDSKDANSSSSYDHSDNKTSNSTFSDGDIRQEFHQNSESSIRFRSITLIASSLFYRQSVYYMINPFYYILKPYEYFDLRTLVKLYSNFVYYPSTLVHPSNVNKRALQYILLHGLEIVPRGVLVDLRTSYGDSGMLYNFNKGIHGNNCIFGPYGKNKSSRKIETKTTNQINEKEKDTQIEAKRVKEAFEGNIDFDTVYSKDSNEILKKETKDAQNNSLSFADFFSSFSSFSSLDSSSPSQDIQNPKVEKNFIDMKDDINLRGEDEINVKINTTSSQSTSAQRKHWPFTEGYRESFDYFYHYHRNDLIPIQEQMKNLRPSFQLPSHVTTGNPATNDPNRPLSPREIETKNLKEQKNNEKAKNLHKNEKPHYFPPVLMLQGDFDIQCSEQEALHTFYHLPNPVKRYVKVGCKPIYRHHYGHLDIIFGTSVDVEVWPHIYKFISQINTLDDPNYFEDIFTKTSQTLYRQENDSLSQVEKEKETNGMLNAFMEAQKNATREEEITKSLVQNFLIGQEFDSLFDYAKKGKLALLGKVDKIDVFDTPESLVKGNKDLYSSLIYDETTKEIRFRRADEKTATETLGELSLIEEDILEEEDLIGDGKVSDNEIEQSSSPSSKRLSEFYPFGHSNDIFRPKMENTYKLRDKKHVYLKKKMRTSSFNDEESYTESIDDNISTNSLDAFGVTEGLDERLDALKNYESLNVVPDTSLTVASTPTNYESALFEKASFKHKVTKRLSLSPTFDVDSTNARIQSNDVAGESEEPKTRSKGRPSIWASLSTSFDLSQNFEEDNKSKNNNDSIETDKDVVKGG